MIFWGYTRLKANVKLGVVADETEKQQRRSSVGKKTRKQKKLQFLLFWAVKSDKHTASYSYVLLISVFVLLVALLPFLKLISPSIPLLCATFLSLFISLYCSALHHFLCLPYLSYLFYFAASLLAHFPFLLSELLSLSSQDASFIPSHVSRARFTCSALCGLQ